MQWAQNSPSPSLPRHFPGNFGAGNLPSGLRDWGFVTKKHLGIFCVKLFGNKILWNFIVYVNTGFPTDLRHFPEDPKFPQASPKFPKFIFPGNPAGLGGRGFNSWGQVTSKNLPRCTLTARAMNHLFHRYAVQTFGSCGAVLDNTLKTLADRFRKMANLSQTVKFLKNQNWSGFGESNIIDQKERHRWIY